MNYNNKISIVRTTCCPDGKGLIGKLYVNGVHFCETLENRDFLIPIGNYKITLEVQSPKYMSKRPYNTLCVRNGLKGCVPRLLNVSGRSGILIHCGNFAKDSMGCILVGRYYPQDKYGLNRIVESRNTFIELYQIMSSSNVCIDLEISDVRNLESIKNIK